MLIRTSTIVIMIFVCIFPNIQYAKDPARIIAGWIENVEIESLDAKFKAKLDTGARTSSIHATDIKEFKRDGKKWVKFTLQLSDSKKNKHQLTLEKLRLRKTKIKKWNFYSSIY